MNVKKIEKEIDKYDEKKYDNINWTKVWSKKYPILDKYQTEVDIDKYTTEIKRLLNSLEEDYNYNRLDAMLVLKDILSKTYFNNKFEFR